MKYETLLHLLQGKIANPKMNRTSAALNEDDGLMMKTETKLRNTT